MKDEKTLFSLFYLVVFSILFAFGIVLKPFFCCITKVTSSSDKFGICGRCVVEYIVPYLMKIFFIVGKTLFVRIVYYKTGVPFESEGEDKKTITKVF